MALEKNAFSFKRSQTFTTALLMLEDPIPQSMRFCRLLCPLQNLIRENCSHREIRICLQRCNCRTKTRAVIWCNIDFHYSAGRLSSLDKQKHFLQLEWQTPLKMLDYLIIDLIAVANQEEKKTQETKQYLRIVWCTWNLKRAL